MTRSRNAGDHMSRRMKQSILLAVLAFSVVFQGVRDCGAAAGPGSAGGAKGDTPGGIVLNMQGREIGSVDRDGIVYNRTGRVLGSVDGEGRVYNAGHTVVGEVSPSGRITNQLGVRLGSVDEKGMIYNRLGTGVGSVSDVTNILITGGAARLILFSGD